MMKSYVSHKSSSITCKKISKSGEMKKEEIDTCKANKNIIITYKNLQTLQKCLWSHPLKIAGKGTRNQSAVAATSKRGTVPQAIHVAKVNTRKMSKKTEETRWTIVCQRGMMRSPSSHHLSTIHWEKEARLLTIDMVLSEGTKKKGCLAGLPTSRIFSTPTAEAGPSTIRNHLATLSLRFPRVMKRTI